MDDKNVPMALPDGSVYSLEAIKALAAQHDGCSFLHPVTNQLINMDRLRKAYFL